MDFFGDCKDGRLGDAPILSSFKVNFAGRPSNFDGPRVGVCSTSLEDKPSFCRNEIFFIVSGTRDFVAESDVLEVLDGGTSFTSVIGAAMLKSLGKRSASA